MCPSLVRRADPTMVARGRGGTDILVVGFQDARKLRPGEILSGKSRKAQELRAAGQRKPSDSRR